MDYVISYFSELGYLMKEMAPWLILGLVFAGLLKVYFPQKHIDKYLGKSNAKSAINASLLGVPMPLCSCGVIPTGISFYKNGASKGATNSFLISTPQTGVDSIFATYSMLGWPFAVLRPLVAFTTGIIGGILTNWLIKEKPVPVPVVNPMFAGLKLDVKKMGKAEPTCDDGACGCHTPPAKETHPLIKAANYAFIELLQDIAKWLILGFLVAALIAVLLPADFFSLFKGYGFIEILVVLAASIPIYVCATGSIPIAAVLLMKGVSPGAALVFLMAGPATNVATMTVIGKTMGRKSLLIYLGSITGGAIIFGLLTNWLIPVDFIMSKMTHMHGGEAHEMLPSWLGITSAIVLVVSVISGYFIERIQKNKKMTLETFQTIRVEGMTCSHCEASVTRNLSKLEGIEEVVADKNTAQVKIKGAKINLAEIERIVTDLGYQYKGSVS
ncbi:MAG TPA: SO_0444 family Cu/Zn efflux transporter [Prolixibacteraceae bacterium]|nr:SO_0444 family Cu/Zn efflux transporter [Prolixibacteraceae bacterium]